MLDKNVLEDLKKSLPERYVQPVKEAYKELYKNGISRWTVMRFFEGVTYSEKLHAAVLRAIKKQKELLSLTEEAIHA